MIGALMWGKARQRLFLGRWCSEALQQVMHRQENHLGLQSRVQEPTHRPVDSECLEVGPHHCWGHCFSDASLIILMYNQDWESLLYGLQKWRRGYGDTCTHQTQTLDFSCKADGNMLQARQSDYLLQPTSDRFGTTHPSSLCLKKPAGLLLSYDSRLKQICNCLIRARTTFQTYPSSSDLNITQGVWLPVPEEECIWFDCFHANEVEPVILGPHRDGWIIGCYELAL